MPMMMLTVMKTKPAPSEREINSSRVPSGGNKPVEGARLLSLELALLHEVCDRGDGGEKQCRISQQRQHNVNGQPGAANGFARPVRNGIAQGRDQRHDEDQRKYKDAEALRFVAPVDAEESHGDQPRAERHGFEEIVSGEMMLHQTLLDDGDQLEKARPARMPRGPLGRGSRAGAGR